MSAVDSAYHYYLSTYGHQLATRYDTHKKSELRSVYCRMLKTNKEAPLYKIQKHEDVPKFLIDIKESARQVKNVVSSLSSDNDSLEHSFQKKVAYSTNEDVVSAKYLGNAVKEEDNTFANFDIEVTQLATPQINTGNFLKNKQSSLAPGDYSFDLSTTNNSYEFQFTVNPSDKNEDVLNKLSRLINTSGIGLSAQIVSNASNESALEITSSQTGLSDSEKYLFHIHPNANSASMHALDVLGIQNVSHPASNSKFRLNGAEHSSFSNTFTINNSFQITLKEETTPDDSVTVGFKTSIDAVADNLQELIDSYNGFIHTGEQYSSSRLGNRLLSDLKDVSRSFRSELEAIGLIVKENGSMMLDRNLLGDALETDSLEDTFSVLNTFKNALFAKADNASINPMKYVDKIIVAYKRPGGNFISPYASSIYAGIMFDRYL